MSPEFRGVIMRSGEALGVALVVCSIAFAQDVKAQAMPGTDFSRFHTYKWVSVESGKHPDQIVDAEIKQGVDAQLAAKGFTKTEDEKADLYVAYQISVDQEKEWNAFGTGGGVRWGGMGSATSSTINIGTLVLDMYDPTSKKLVWQGEVTKTIDPSKSPEKNQEHINKAMQKLLKSFPPGQHK